MKNRIFFFIALAPLLACGPAEPTESQGEQQTLATDSVEQAVSNVRNTCFGASGSNCSGLPNGFCSNSTTAGWVNCSVAIGSQMHDSCCMRYPGGDNCGGSTAQYCTPPAGSKYVGSTYKCCKAEWDHAVGDMAAGRYWSWGFKESVVAPAGYSMASTAVVNGEVTSYPNGNSIRPKSGSKIWIVDAQRGWCANGYSSSGASDAICN